MIETNLVIEDQTHGMGVLAVAIASDELNLHKSSIVMQTLICLFHALQGHYSLI